MVLKISPLVLAFIFFFLSIKSISQPKIKPLESHSYLSPNEITKLLNIIKSAPLISADDECNAKECSAIETYRNAIINLKEDLYEYQNLVKLSAVVSKNSWENYLYQTINNEDLKGRMQYSLAFKDLFAQLAALIVDMVDIANLAEKKDLSGNSIGQLFEIFEVLDDILSLMDVYVKVADENLDNNTLTELTGIPNFYSAYTLFKAGFDTLKESLAHFGGPKVWRALTTLEKTKKMKTASARNVGAALVNILGIYSNYERDLMRAAVKELDDVLDTNEDVQNLHYNKLKLKNRLIESISKVINEINLCQESMRTANLKCGVLTFTRLSRKKITRSHDRFGEGLRYYKSILDTTTSNIHLSWKAVKSCVGNSYSMIVYDGIGNVRTAYLEIKRNSDKQIIFQEPIDSKTKFKLTADSYLFKLHSGRTKDGIRNKAALINYYVVKGADKKRVIELSPFGRVSLKVTDKSGKLQPFRYKFYDSNKKLIDYSFSTIYKEEIMDLPVNTEYTLELNYGDNIYKIDKKEAIKITPKKINNLHFIYEDGQFLAKQDLKSKETPNITTLPLKQKPVGWASGILYNSNDGNCSRYKGKSLEFLNRDSKILNLKTGVYSQSIVLRPGEQVPVAIPSEASHLRVTFPGETSAISFWYPGRITNKWWYAAGCEDGTKPIESDCNNGYGEKRCHKL